MLIGARRADIEADTRQDLNTYGVCNSYSNIGNPKPRQNIYPKSAKDAPYSVPELALRSAIYIPSNFTYGRKAPVILIPYVLSAVSVHECLPNAGSRGTGVEACESFYTNYYKLLKQTDYADPVFLNVPDNLLDDQQTNAEYVAYATNYIASISGRNVTTVSWSAGSICGQWARKYWPSTRSVTDSANHVSADYHGTTLVPLICPPGIPCSPAVLQQNYNSTWIQTLRNNGGDSAYTATTSCWSVYDEIVEPQTDPGASAHVNNANGAPVLNAQVQQICGSASLAGAPNFGHEGALYNAVCYALISDAIKHNGVADLQRSGAQAMCNQLYTPGLDLIDNLVTESTIPIAALNIELYPKKVLTEPAIRTYAQKDIPK